ncbi:hypothetical protein Daus18300_006128 [Diaporthe australafricana]|uniref:F-box domain-containing protein n=1 Tax=Diaporthe australafricana TaxID=127596 RepID=A0ABR3WWI2_9PEZI
MSERTRDNYGLIEANPHLTVGDGEHEHQERQTSMGDLCLSLAKLRFCTPPVEKLSDELLLQVLGHLVHPFLLTGAFSDAGDAEQDGTTVDRRELRNVCLVSRTFKRAATTLLYRCAHLATSTTPGSLLSSLHYYPLLRPLVKEISVPVHLGDSGRRPTYAYSISNTAYYDVPNEDEISARLSQPSPFAESVDYVPGGILRHIVQCVPQLRALTIPQTSLVNGPFTRNLILWNLTKLRIHVMVSNEVTLYTYDVAIETSFTLRWLSPGFIGERFPALERLELCTPTGTWVADLVAGDTGMEGGALGKYVESLKTTETGEEAPAEWSLLSLRLPIFHPSKLRALEFSSPGFDCYMQASHSEAQDWDLNRFLETSGSGLQTLSLDWGCDDLTWVPESYFGPAKRITGLNKLPSLTHLTISLGALFRKATIFNLAVQNLERFPDEGLEWLPEQLRTLRISEFVPGVVNSLILGPEDDDMAAVDGRNQAENICVRKHNGVVCRFIRLLRDHWLPRAEGRELWFLRFETLDWRARLTGEPRGRDGLVASLGQWEPEGPGFERVLPPSSE